MHVYSEPAQGSIFNVYLPAVQKEEMVEPDDEEGLPAGTERILLVDDEPLLVEVGQNLLEMLGYTVTPLGGSLEALERFRKNPEAFDLVISDVTMPKMTGDKLAMEMLRIRPDLPIILVTGFTKKINEAVAREMGVKALIMKPIVKRKLARVIRDVLDETLEIGSLNKVGIQKRRAF